MKTKIISVVLFVLFIYGCANRGAGPQGGPKDETPPKMLKSKPAPDALNYSEQTIELEFDEFIQIKDIQENLIISPPQKKRPVIAAAGKKISIELQDSLSENTTYTIDFGNSIADNNEGNVLGNFSIAFSTGDVVDSLEIRGVLIDAETLTLVPNVFVGIHSDLRDSAFVSKAFSRVTKTNEKGEFIIKNVRDGSYRIYALGDKNSNLFFDQAAEWIAFNDSLVTPVEEIKIAVNDSIANDSIPQDTIKKMPEEIQEKLLLRFFKEDAVNQYLASSERNAKEKFTLIFNAPLEEFPKIEPLNFEFKDNYLLQNSKNKDTLIYWLKDTVLTKLDTLNFILHYPKTDTLGILQPVQDTLFLVQKQQSTARNQQRNNRRANRKENEEKEKVETKIEYFTYKTNVSGGKFEYYDFPSLIFDAPAKDFDLEKIHLEHNLRDSLWENIAFEFIPLDSFGIAFELYVDDLKSGEKYKLSLDSAAFTSIFDKSTEKRSYQFSIRREEEYSTLIANVSPFDSRIIIQLLNNNDEVVMQEKADESGTIFYFINPGTYFLRLFIDENENEKWDTGNFLENKQPEKMYYFNKPLTLRANWEVEEDWDYEALPILEQKPEGIKAREF